jgi:hypothetical protein
MEFTHPQFLTSKIERKRCSTVQADSSVTYQGSSSFEIKFYCAQSQYPICLQAPKNSPWSKCKRPTRVLTCPLLANLVNPAGGMRVEGIRVESHKPQGLNMPISPSQSRLQTSPYRSSESLNQFPATNMPILLIAVFEPVLDFKPAYIAPWSSQATS